MNDFDAPFEPDDVLVNNDHLVWDGFFKMYALHLKHRKFDGGWTDEIKRELFHRGEAAAAILYDPKRDEIALVDQFRVGTLESEHGPWCLEVVAGMMDKDETPEQLVLRELQEEAGVVPYSLVPITSYYSSPGGCSEKIHVFCALCDLADAGGVHGVDSENEDIMLRVFPADTVFAAMLNSRMNNAATLIALLWLQQNRATFYTMK